MVSSESPVPHNTNKTTATYTNCAMLQELTVINTLYCTLRLSSKSSLRNWFRDDMCSVLKTLLLIPWNVF